MKKKLHTLMIAVCTLLGSFYLEKSYAQEQERRIPLTGFNYDVIADSVLNTSPTASTTGSMDVPIDSGTVFFAQGYSNNGVAYANGLPDSGSFISSAGHGFQLAAYNANNDLRLDTSASGTLTFSSAYQTAYDSLFVLISGTNGGVGSPAVTYKITFADNTTDSSTLYADDWFCVNCTPYAIRNLSRVDRQTGNLDGSNQFAIREYEINLITQGFQMKPIKSINFSVMNNTQGTANIFGITGYTMSPLPVSLAYFTAKVQNGVVLLEWKSSQELNNKEYIIERASAVSPNSFSRAGVVNATAFANGSVYHFANALKTSGTYLYRLSQVDIDGKIKVLGVRSITLNTNSAWQVQDLGVEWKIISDKKFTYRVIDMNGNVLKESTESGSATISKPLAHGIYLIQVIIDGQASAQKVIY